jgi:DNA modification methylase
MHIHEVKISEVKKNPNNPRTIKDEKFAKLVQSIREFPEMLRLRPIVVNDDMIVLGGNMRLKACKEAGLKVVPIIKASDLTEDQQRQFIIKDNVGFGEWDWEMLANEWDADKLGEWGLDLPDMDVKVLDAEEDDFDVPDGGIETDIVPGDLFEIGEHRLLCGDSTNADDVARLMNGSPISKISVLTDPPYGIKWNGNYKRFTKNGKADSTTNYDDIKNDDQDFDPNQFYEYDECIIWGANIFSNKLDRGSWLIWDKRTADGFSFLADAEIAWEKGSKYGCYIKSINQQSEKSKTKDIRHPTKKPIDLMSWCIERLNKTSIIYDAYSGSGSTMVAAHQLGRKCYGMELDPKYCQVIVDRMRKLDPSLEIKRNGKLYK